MEGKIIDFTPEHIQNLILKKPKESLRHTPEAPEYISEVWYLCDRLYQPIFRTPRMRIKYGARQWTDESGATATGRWSYCLGLYNYDIDPEIKSFYEGIKDYDKHIITYWTNNKKTWNLKHATKIKAKYFTALKRRTPEDEPYFSLKLITGKDGTVMTTINGLNRKALKPEDISYGNCADQYISPSYILFNSTGIHPVWSAHQVVISPIERIFLDICLLDDIERSEPEPEPALSIQNMVPNIPWSGPPPPPPAPTLQPLSRSHLVKKEDLLNALSNLKCTQPVKTPKGDRNLITPEELMAQYTRIRNKAIMLDSVKGIPVEGEI